MTINTRCREVIGYGMSVGDFLRYTKLPIRQGHFFDALGECLRGINGSDNLKWGEQVVTSTGIIDLFMAPKGYVMMVPTIGDMERWYRTRYIEECAPPRGFMYLDFPIHPYGVFMDGNGVEVAQPHGGGDPALIPGIPPVMRWWLTRYGVFDLTGIAKLRPLLGDWWA